MLWVQERVESMVCGMDRSLVLADSRELYSFGDNWEVLVANCWATGDPSWRDPVILCAAGLVHSLVIASSTESRIGKTSACPANHMGRRNLKCCQSFKFEDS